MKPRQSKYTKTYLLLAILCSSQIILLVGNVTAQSPSPLVETRAVWLNHYAFNTDTARNDTLDKILSANLNTVFLIAPPVGDNKGWSSVSDFSTMLDALVTDDLSVHAWVANLYRRVGHVADFTNETERAEQVDWTLALLETYPELDGIHFDYIRTEYLGTVNATMMDAITDLVRDTKDALRSTMPDKYLTTAGWPLSGEVRTPDDELPDWYTEWFEAHENDPVNRWGKEGYDYDGYPTFFGVQQDPVTWVSDAELDFHISMEYCYQTAWWKGEVDIWNTFPEGVVHQVFMGLGWYSGVWEGESWTEQQVADEVVEKIHYGRENNINGFSVFEFGEPGNDDDILITALAGDEGSPFWEDAVSAFHEADSTTTPDYSALIVIAALGVVALVVIVQYRRI